MAFTDVEEKMLAIRIPIASFQTSMLTHQVFHALKGAHDELNDDTRGTPSEPPRSRDSRSVCDGWRPKPRQRPPPTGARSSRLRAGTSPPHRSNCPRWRASEHSSAGAGCSRAFPSRCVLRSVMHCGPTLSRTPTRAKRTPSQVPTPSRFFAAWPPRRRRVPTQLLRRPDKRESVRDARRAAPRGPRAGLGRDVRHVGAGARGSTPGARPPRRRHAAVPPSRLSATSPGEP